MKCPFCDSASAVMDDFLHPSRPAEYFVRCKGCMSLGPSCANPDQALERWNRVLGAVESQTQKEVMVTGGLDVVEDLRTQAAGTLDAEPEISSSLFKDGIPNSEC